MAKKKDTLTLDEKLQEALVPVEEQPHAVPSNWVWTRFNSIISDIADGPFGSNLKREHYTDKNEVRIIQLSNIGENGWRNENTKYTTFSHANTISRSMVNAGEIVMAKMMPAGRSIIVPEHEKAYVLSSDAVKIIPTSKMNKQFLLQMINSTFFRNQIAENTQGITRVRTSIGKLKTYPTPLPSLAEQERIVKRIESLFSKLDQAKDLAQSALDSFANRKSAILYQAFTGELTTKWREQNGVSLDSWEETTLGKKLLPTQSKKPTGDYFDYIDIDSIDNKIQAVRFPKTLEVCNAPSRANREVKIKDVLFSLVRPYLKNIAFIDKSLQNCIASTGFHVCRSNGDILPQYLYRFLCSDYNINYLTTFMKGDNSPSIRKNDLLGITINLPSLPEQTEIVRILDSLFEKEDKSKELTNVITQIDHMKKAILARAFRGELDTNDPQEESAMELLKEILQEEKEKEKCN